MKAKEKLGKRSTVRKEPHVRGDAVGFIEPYSTITFVEIVTDKFQPLDSWLKLGDGRYVNYKNAGRFYYDVIDEVPEPEVLPLTITIETEYHHPQTVTLHPK